MRGWKPLANFIGRIHPNHSGRFHCICKELEPTRTITYNMFKDVRGLPTDACKGFVEWLVHPETSGLLKKQAKLHISRRLMHAKTQWRLSNILEVAPASVIHPSQSMTPFSIRYRILHLSPDPAKLHALIHKK